MHRIRLLTVSAASLIAAVPLLLPSTAQAKRKSPLAGKPVVVNKMELRKFRFTVTPFAGMSLSQPYVHEGYVGGKLNFYFTDWIGVRGTFGWAVLQLPAKLLKAVESEEGGLPRGSEVLTDANGNVTKMYPGPIRDIGDKDNPAPLLHDFQAGLTHNQWLASADVVFVPFAGKLGLFSGIFTEYDIYIFGGLGLSGWNRYYPDVQSTSQRFNIANGGDPGNGARNCLPMVEGLDANESSRIESECLLHPVQADTGVKLGPSFGAGLHLMLGVEWVALNLEIQDIMSYNNIAGLNATTEEIPPVIDGSDRNWNHNVQFQLGFKFYFPPKVKRTKLKAGQGKKKGKAKASVSTKKKK